MTTLALSGPSRPASYLPAVAPVIATYPATTAAEVALVCGTYAAGATLEAFDGGAWVALEADCMMRENAFVFPAILKTGANVIQIRAKDRFGAYSSTATCTITRVARALHRTTRTTVAVNGVDATSYAHDVAVETSQSDGVVRLAASIAGWPSRITTDDTLAVTIHDGAASVTKAARVLTATRTFDGGTRTQKIVAQGAADALPRLTMTTSFSAATNGGVLAEILTAAGYTTLYLPRGNAYTGPRSVEKAKVYESIVLPMLFAEDWSLWPVSSTEMIVLPSFFSRFVWFTYTDTQVVALSEVEDRSALMNKARAVYQSAEPDLNINYELGEQLPDKSSETTEGFAWFNDDDYARVVTEYAADSVIFFAAWGGAIDWSRAGRAVLKVKFSNTPNEIGGTKFSYNVDLEVFAAKHIAVGYFDLRRYHLPAGTVLYYAFNVQDSAGAYIGNGNEWRTIRLTGTESGNFRALLTQFGVQLSAPEKVGSYNASWTITTSDAGPKATENGITYARYDQVGTQVVYTFYVEVALDDVALHTLDFDLDQALEHAAGDAHLLNCEIITDENSEFNGNPWIYGVISHKPNAPIRRVDKVIFKFRATVTIGQRISIAFNIWGRKFVNTGSYEDYESINVEHTNAASAAAHGTIDGGALISAFWSSKTQALRRLRKFVDARAVPMKREELRLPGSSEIRAGQLIRVFSIANGAAYNHYYRIVEAAPDKDLTRVVALRGISVAVDDAIVEPAIPDAATDLSDTIKALAPPLKTLQFGTVAANKYRGMFRVDLDSGQSIQNVVARIARVKSGDKVAVIQSGDGTWMIVEIVTASTSNIDIEEELKPADELKDEPAAEKVIDDSIPGAEELKQQYLDATNRPDDARPMPNFITVDSITTDPSPDGTEIPTTGVVFELRLSHEVKCYRTKNGRNDRNLTNFVYITDGGVSVPLTGKRVSERVYRFTPTNALTLGAKVVFGFKPIDRNHPAHRGYSGPTVNLWAEKAYARTDEGMHVSAEYVVEPEFKISAVEVYGPNVRRVTFQGKPWAQHARDNSKYYILTVQTHDDET